MPKPDESEDKAPTGADDIRSVVETANAEDEKDKDDDVVEEGDDDSDEEDSNDEGDEDADDDAEDDESDDAEEDADKKPKPSKKGESAERKFKNLAADEDAEYISNIEKAYENSSAEAVRLNTELGQATRRVNSIMQAVAKDPDLADRLNKAIGGTGGAAESGDDAGKPADSDVLDTSNPFLVHSKTEWENKSRTEVAEILEANPELTSDPELNANVRHWMEVFSGEEFKKNKRLMSGGEAMLAAMKHVGVEDKRKKQDVSKGAKALASPSRPSGARKPKKSTKAPLNDSAYKFGELMGVSREKVEKYAQK